MYLQDLVLQILLSFEDEIDPGLFPGGYNRLALIPPGLSIPSGYTVTSITYDPPAESPFYIGSIGANTGYITASLQGTDLDFFIADG